MMTRHGRHPTMALSRLSPDMSNAPEGLRYPASQNRARKISTRSTSHHQKHPARKQILTTNARHVASNFYALTTFLIIMTCCCSFSTATPTLPPSLSNPMRGASGDLRAQLDALAESGTIIIDQRPPPLDVTWQLETIEGDLRRRQNGDPFGASSSSSASAKASTSTTSTASTSTSAVASSTTAAGSAATGAASPLPSPFDTSLGANFTSQSCPDYISSFLSSAAFKACLPISLLLENSQSFFQAAKSIVRITQTLDATCAANITTCTQLMSTIANNLTSSSNCGDDLKAQNPTVQQAYTGLIAYKPLYQATCLKNPATSAYCFADAITNASSPTDSYIYYLPLNNSLPGGSQPTCNNCLQQTMAVFDAAAANTSQPMSSTYVGAANQINIQCGPNFVNASIPAPVSSGASSAVMENGPLASLILAFVVAAWLF